MRSTLLKLNIFHIIQTIHEGVKRFICDLCKASFVENWTLQKHIKNVHETILFKCKSCSMEFRRKTELEKHIDFVHKGVENYPCDLCDHSFASPLRNLNSISHKLFCKLENTYRSTLKIINCACPAPTISSERGTYNC